MRAVADAVEVDMVIIEIGCLSRGLLFRREDFASLPVRAVLQAAIYPFQPAPELLALGDFPFVMKRWIVQSIDDWA